MGMSDYFGSWMNVINPNILENTLKRVSATRFLPQKECVFNAFLKCDYNNLKVVFLGMDPYPQPGVATGVAFANSIDTQYDKISPSLKVIIESLKANYDDLPNGEFDITLDSWSRQGVLLLNSALTVYPNKPGSHALIWRPFISNLLNNLSERKKGLIFVLFGSQAESFEKHINSSYIIKCQHPSYFARKNMPFPYVFKQIDDMMIQNGMELIYWL